jgi:hypothetical protein
MTPINAIAKVRFSSAKAQRVHLVESHPLSADLLCLESRQEIAVPSPAILYAITGAATVIDTHGKLELSAGQLVALEVDATVSNPHEQRLVCLAYHTS